MYVGEVKNAQVLGDGSRMSATLKVSERFVGDVFDQEEVITEDTSCRAFFELKGTYLVFEDKNGLVNSCTMRNIYFIDNLEQHLTALRILKK